MANINFNSVILGGRFTADPEVKTTAKGQSVCEFTLAIDRKTKNKVTDFIKCTAWDKQAELVSTYFKKGSPILLRGTIQTHSYEAKDGSKRTEDKVVLQELSFVNSKGEEVEAMPKYEGTPKFEDVPEEDMPF